MARFWCLLLLLLLLLLLSVNCCRGDDEQAEKEKENMSPLAASILRARKSVMLDEDVVKNYWKRTFREIKDLVVVDGPKRGNDFLTQWKLFLDKTEESPEDATINDDVPAPPKRFEGFPSWDRLLQQWAEDVAEYMEDREYREYPLSTYGRPSPSLLEKDQQKVEEKKSASGFPIPKPVRPGQAVLPHTDLSDKTKRIWIVTTAALPWMTGTAVNPLLRAAYLAQGRKGGGSVTLMLPWLERRDDQERVYGKVFDDPTDQEAYVRDWLRNDAGMPQASERLRIAWYTAWQERAENSLYSMGDITSQIPAEQVDICVLEEPEHLNWYRSPTENWTTKFKHVVGIIHTNYFVYAQEQPGALVRAPAMRLLCSWMCRAHCHRLIKLSGTLGRFAPEKELVENVHGVRGTFLDIGAKLRSRLKNDAVFGADAEPTVYFLGKMLWSKGLGSLMELLKFAEESADLRLRVDMYGGGPDKDAAEAKAAKLELDMPFHGPLDHSKLAFTHKVFVNPSISEVLCTATAEALAMGKFVVLPSHPSNDFFAQFPNCLPYSNKDEFIGNLYYAMTHAPEPLEGEYAHALSWQAATERFEAAGAISVEEAQAMETASLDGSVEIELPQLIESKQRERIASTLRMTRLRYSQFRSRLSEEVKQNKVLPAELRDRLLARLEQGLDVDIDSILESPKLRLQLSPAELDKRLLQLFNNVAAGPSGDIVRVIGGGTIVGRQNLYMRQQAMKQQPEGSGPAQWVRLALQRNSGKTQKHHKIDMSMRMKPAIPKALRKIK